MTPLNPATPLPPDFPPLVGVEVVVVGGGRVVVVVVVVVVVGSGGVEGFANRSGPSLVRIS
jgi:hypothetical protein